MWFEELEQGQEKDAQEAESRGQDSREFYFVELFIEVDSCTKHSIDCLDYHSAQGWLGLLLAFLGRPTPVADIWQAFRNIDCHLSEKT